MASMDLKICGASNAEHDKTVPLRFKLLVDFAFGMIPDVPNVDEAVEVQPFAPELGHIRVFRTS